MGGRWKSVQKWEKVMKYQSTRFLMAHKLPQYLKTIDMAGVSRMFRIILDDEKGAIHCMVINSAKGRNKMTREELAGKLDGNQYRNEISKKLEAEAKAAKLVVIFGASYDLIEFRGAIADEQGACDGTTVLIDSAGLLPARDKIDDDDELEKLFRRRKTAKELQVLWNREPEYSWTYETDIPHSTFDIIRDGDKYCRGIVLSLEDVV